MYSPTYSYCQVVNRDFALSSKKATYNFIGHFFKVSEGLFKCLHAEQQKKLCVFLRVAVVHSFCSYKKRRASVWNISCDEYINSAFL